MATIEQRNGGWRLRWRDLRDRPHSKQYKSKKAAAAAQHDCESALERNRDWDPNPLRRAPTLEQTVGDYLIDRERVWADGTLRHTRISLSVFVSWMEPGAGVEALDEDVLAPYWTYLVDDRAQIPATANRRVRDVQGFWRWAYAKRELQPIMHYPSRIDMKRARSAVGTAPTWTQMDSAVAAAWKAQGETGTWLGIMLTIARYTGLRHRQLLGLTWDHVDLNAGTLSVTVDLAKSDSDVRTIPLAPPLRAFLLSLASRDGFVVPTPGKRTPCTSTFRRVWERAEVPVGVRQQPVHAFRHGVIAGLAELRVPEEVRKAYVGHSRGVHGGYTGANITPRHPLWTQLVEAVGKIPEIGAKRRPPPRPAPR